MKIFVRISSEITIKSPSARKHFIQLLRKNIRGGLVRLQKNICVQGNWDVLEITLPDTKRKEEVFALLTGTPGIEWVAEVMEFPLLSAQKPKESFDDILANIVRHMAHDIAGKTFCVRVQRSGKHAFTSMDAERYIGGGIRHNIPDTTVQLKHPEKTVSIIIKDNRVFLRGKKRKGIGGFPVGSQGKVLCLLSGGFDSGVVAHMMMNRGCKVDFLFCNLGGMAHEIGVRKMAYHLWKTTSPSFPVKLFSVPFEPIVAELLEKTKESLRGVLLKRMMLRAAETIARKKRYRALVTGECLAQVSSQTLQNLKIIDTATDMLVLRPLIGMNKSEIIQRAQNIGTADIAGSMPEYCGVVSNKPTIYATAKDITTEEEKCDAAVLKKVCQETKSYTVGEWISDDFLVPTVTTVHAVGNDEVVIDIREPEEWKEMPLHFSNGKHTPKVLHIPFYSLQEKFPKEDQNKTYLLYCERGVISRAQAEMLIKKGFRNVKVFRIS